MAKLGDDVVMNEGEQAVKGRGAFIVIEGLDRSGKTTQVKLLVDALISKSISAKAIRFPDRTTSIGQLINSYLANSSSLSDHSIHLLFSANRWELAKSIEDDIASGTTIVCDRYTYSGMIYSVSKRNPSLDIVWARDPDVGLPRPDAVYFLDLETEDAEKRGGYGNERYEKREMQVEVRRLFHLLADGHIIETRPEEPTEIEEREDLHIIDAGGSISEVHERLFRMTLDTQSSVRKAKHPLRKIGRWGTL